MRFDCIEIIGRGTLDFVCRVQDSMGIISVCKKSPTSSILPRIPAHPNILPLIAQGPHKDGWLQLFPDYQSIDLEQLRRRRNIQPFHLQLSLQLCTAIAHIHQHGFVHRDIKPSNIILTKDGCLFLIDFGRGYQAEHHQSRIMGSQAYMAPEVRSKGIYSTASDIFSVAVIVHILLFNTLPKKNKDIPPHPLKGILQACLSPDVHDRPSAKELFRQLSSCEQSHKNNTKTLKAWSQIHIPNLCDERKNFFSKHPLPIPFEFYFQKQSVHILERTKKLKYKWLIGLLFFSLSLWFFSRTRTLPTSPKKPVVNIPKQEIIIPVPQNIPIKRKESLPKMLSPSTPSKRMTKSIKEDPIQTQMYRFSSIPWGGEVWIDDVYIGVTLLQDVELTKGEHRIKMKYNAHESIRTLYFDDSISGFLWHSETDQWKKLQGQ